MERNGVAPFLVLDDFKEMMDPESVRRIEESDGMTFKLLYGPDHRKVSAAELLKPLEDWQVDCRCLRSIKYKPEETKVAISNKEKARASIKSKNDLKLAL